MVLSKEQAFDSLSKASLAFIGTMSEAVPGVSTRSMPPIQHYQLKFTNIQPLRGNQFQSEEFHYSQKGAALAGRVPIPIQLVQGVAQASPAPQAEQNKIPTAGVQYLACLRDASNIDELVELDSSMINQLTRSANLPLGWQANADGQLESPWQHSQAKQISWHQQSNYSSHQKCSRSGRPLLNTGNDITFTCEPVQAAQVFEFKNPDGDGVFKLTVTNNTDHNVEIPALLRDSQSKKILWEESVFVKTNRGNHFFPGHGHAKNVEATVLQARQSVSGKLDTLTLKDLEWPQGGWRLNLQFCLGEKGTNGSYYYFTDHHEPIRLSAEKKSTAFIE